ncbi:MAG TPA: hypothetical protein VN948_22220, partial [Terriglobales bacterium]|nr:hypothetical protein [Terriglobales bacterium]
MNHFYSNLGSDGLKTRMESAMVAQSGPVYLMIQAVPKHLSAPQKQRLNSLLKNSFSDSLLPVTSFPDSAPVAGFPPVAEDRSVAELGIFQ